MIDVSKKYDLLSSLYDVIYKTYTKRTVFHALRTAILQGDERICDIGCGTGALEEVLLPRYPKVEVVGCDISHQMVQRARRKISDSDRVTFLEGDFAALHFPKDSFDVLFSLSNLHYFPDPFRVFAKARDVVKTDGRLVMVDWCYGSWQSRCYQMILKLGDASFQKIYSLKEITTILAATGWDVSDIQYFSVRGWWQMMAIRARCR